MQSPSMENILRVQRRAPLFSTINPGLEIRRRLCDVRVHFSALDVGVRAELDGLLGDGAIHRFVLPVPERALTEAVLEPHQRRDDRYDLSHRTGKLRKEKSDVRRVRPGKRVLLTISWPLSFRTYKIRVTINTNG